MTGEEMVRELLACFVPPPGPMIKKMDAIAETIPADSREAVIARIIENETANSKLSVKHIVDACRAIGVGYHEARYVPATDWICDACGERFRYTICASDDEKIDMNIHDVCPMCGFQPGWTQTAKAYKTMGTPCGWYDDLLAMFKGPDAHGPKTSKGVYWSRHKAERERAESSKRNVKTELSAIANRQKAL